MGTLHYEKFSLISGLFLGLRAAFGDLVKSFFKRRKGIKVGHPWVPFDQIDYVLGGILFFSIFYIPGPKEVITLLLTGFVLHLTTNLIGYYLGIRERKI